MRLEVAEVTALPRSEQEWTGRGVISALEA